MDNRRSWSVYSVARCKYNYFVDCDNNGEEAVDVINNCCPLPIQHIVVGGL